MKKKSNAAQAKADRVLRSRAMEASAESAIRAPAPDTWAARMPAYTYTSLCPAEELRKPLTSYKGKEEP